MNKLILITGGSASGKTHLALKLKDLFADKALLLSQDSFYKPNGNLKQNYDEPEAFDFINQTKVIEKLLKSEATEVPIYDFEKHDVVNTKKVNSSKIIIFEGIFSFYHKKLFDMADFKIFVDTPSDTRLARRILRDVKERGRDIDAVISRWINEVQPSYIKYVQQVKKQADIVVPWHKIKDQALRSLAITISHLGLSNEETKEHAINNI